MRFLLDHDLVDTLNLLVFPVILGRGRRLFATRGLGTGLELEELQTTPSGVSISVYRARGRVRVGEVGSTGEG